MQSGDRPDHVEGHSKRLHVVFGSGGTKAVLAGCGAALAFHVANLHKWETIGAASGGTFPASMYATGAPPRRFLRLLLDTDIDALLEPNTGRFGQILALAGKYRAEKVKPRRGAFSTRRVRRMFSTLIPEWPSRFWTVATCDHGQVLFTESGVFKYSGVPRTGSKLRDEPASVGMALCASSAIPGVMDSVKLHGELLFDGALSGDGDVPTDVISRHFHDNDCLILAIDIGPEPMKQARWLRLLWNIFCGGACDAIDGTHPEEGGNLIVARPLEIRGFHSLEFKLSRDQKWHAVIAGFTSTVAALNRAHMVEGETERLRLTQLATALEALDRAKLAPGELTTLAQNLLSTQGWF